MHGHLKSVENCGSYRPALTAQLDRFPQKVIERPLIAGGRDPSYRGATHIAADSRLSHRYWHITPPLLKMELKKDK